METKHFLTGLFFLFFISSSRPAAQDISGMWTGYLKTSESRLDYEIAINKTNTKFNGYSLIVFLKDGIPNVGLKTLKINIKNKKIFIEDGELVYDNYTTGSRRVKMFGLLALKLKDTLLVLSGTFRTRSMDLRNYHTYSGEIYLKKQYKPELTKMLPQLEELNLLPMLTFIHPEYKKPVDTTSTGIVTARQKPIAPVNLADRKKTGENNSNSKDSIGVRKTEVIQSLVFTTDTLIFSLVDNGVIDGDIVSLILSGNYIVEKAELTARAIRVIVPIKAVSGESFQLLLKAESLGTIPPNSGLLIIQDGTKKHEIRFSGDLQKSPVVILRKQ